MEWTKGMRVEACSSDDGYSGAWFEGVIVSVSKTGRLFKIRYDKFITHDKKPLVEEVRSSHLRPIPPHSVLPLQCSSGDAVEAYDTDCWWRGVIIKLLPCEEELWAVYLPDNYILKAYPRSSLRPGLQWQGGKWMVLCQERYPSIEQVIRSLTTGKSGEAPVKTLPSEVKITAVSHGGHGKKRNRDVSSNPTATAGENSKVYGARKKLRLIENIVSRSIQEDARDNSRPSGVRKKLRLISDIVSRHVQEDSETRKTCKGGKDFEHRKKAVLSPFKNSIERVDEERHWKKLPAGNEIQTPEAHEKGGKDFEHRKKVKLGPVLSPFKNSIKRVDAERHWKKLPTGNEIQTPEAHEKARRLNSSKSKQREHNLKSRECGEACRNRRNNKRNGCGIAMENNRSTYDRNKIMRAAHKWELIVYKKLLRAFHTDGDTLSQERCNIIDVLRLRLNITRVEHRFAMKEVDSPQAC